MIISENVILRDANAIWHPCSQMKDYEEFSPLHVKSAKGSYLILNNGTKILDAISSWWCKSLGHAHPKLRQALLKQTKKFEHVILANTTNETIVELSERLTSLFHNLKKIFYASDGSSAIEIALKMSLHARIIKQQPHKNQYVALQNAYHGETLLALAVSDIGIYRQPYQCIMPKIKFIQDVPYVNSSYDELWKNCAANWMSIQAQLDKIKQNLSAIIIEPIVQGAAGMLVYSADFLPRLKNWCVANDVHLIADEIMTGFGRTGKWFACEHAGIEPDFMCLGKGLTAGWLPMSAVLLTNEIYNLFYDDFETGNSFLHSHTHSGNALAAAVALETIKIMQEETLVQRASDLQQTLYDYMQTVKDKTKKIKNIRGIGGIIAADLEVGDDGRNKRVGYEVYKKAVTLGALLRPLGNTIYWLPPLNIKLKDLQKLRDITIGALLSSFFREAGEGARRADEGS